MPDGENDTKPKYNRVLLKISGEALMGEESFGIAAILNTTIVDNYFRSLNGNTQVNATEVRSMPFPEMNDIRRIGRIVYDQMTMGCKVDFDRTVAEVMGVERMYMAASDGAEEVHEQS